MQAVDFDYGDPFSTHLHLHECLTDETGHSSVLSNYCQVEKLLFLKVQFLPEPQDSTYSIDLFKALEAYSSQTARKANISICNSLCRQL